MACYSPYESESDSDLEYSVLPYQFEPLRCKSDEKESLSDETDDSSSSEDDLDSSRLRNADWCSCGDCMPMPTAQESICCQENDNVLEKIDLDEGASDHNCITELESFINVCTNKDVLDTALVSFLLYEGPIDDEPLNDTYRYVAYRQWTGWIYGKLDRFCRRPIPSCVVKKIRSTFPSEDGTYKGFEYARQI